MFCLEIGVLNEGLGSNKIPGIERQKRNKDGGIKKIKEQDNEGSVGKGE
jgi:hypothetical protein